VTGLATSAGVESTIRTGWNLGYNVVAVTDAMTDFDEESSRHSIEKIFPMISERELTANILGRLSQ
jgi:nicotinamidase-related amidase